MDSDSSYSESSIGVRDIGSLNGMGSDTSSDGDPVEIDEEEIARLENMEDSQDFFIDPNLLENAAPPNFDVELPGQHIYLGLNMKELTGRTVYDANSEQVMPLLVQSVGILSLPGQVIPLNIHKARLVESLRSVIDGDRTFGLLNGAMIHLDDEFTLVGCVGVTAEIFEYLENGDGLFNGLRLKARCRQRFRVLEFFPKTGTKGASARVRILPDILLPEFRTLCGRFTAKLATRVEQHKLNSALTGIPPWIFGQYEEKALIERMKKELSSWGLIARSRYSDEGETVPDDANALSYWVAQNLPLVDTQRLHLLTFNSAAQRLRWELSFLSEWEWMACSTCGTHIAAANDVFPMSCEGPVGTFVNPGGYIHETLTVRAIRNVTMSGSPSAYFSWYPGYEWEIVNCNGCQNHLGWYYQSDIVRPNEFWGLARASTVPTLKTGNLDSDPGFRPIV